MVRIDKEDLELMATITVWIWLHINKVVYEGDFTHPSQLERSAKE